MNLPSRYRYLRRFAVFFLVVECAVGMGGALTAGHEIFPFASWFLFVLVPNRMTEYDLIVRAVGGQPIAPTPFNRADTLAWQSRSIVSYQVIQQFGRAVESRDAGRIRREQRRVDALFQTPHLRYEIVRLTYDPVARWKTGAVRHQESLGTFTMEAEKPAATEQGGATKAEGE